LPRNVRKTDATGCRRKAIWRILRPDALTLTLSHREREWIVGPVSVSATGLFYVKTPSSS
jgi:hypothetical protein